MASKKVYDVKMTLQGISPAIWRRMRISGDYTSYTFHGAIQLAFGWRNEHLFEFRKKDLIVRQPDEFLDTPSEKAINPSDIKIEELLKRKGSKIDYTYDFGDNWEVLIEVEGTERVDDMKYPVCTDGERSGPPEDCGGIPGYEHLLNVLDNPEHPDYKEYKEDYEGFDPGVFDIDETNKIIKYIFYDELQEMFNKIIDF